MAAGSSIDVSGWLEEQLAQAGPGLLCLMVQTFAGALMAPKPMRSAGLSMASAAMNARTPQWLRHRDWDTRAGSISLVGRADFWHPTR